jgi:hypothetical protein
MATTDGTDFADFFVPWWCAPDSDKPLHFNFHSIIYLTFGDLPAMIGA